MYFKGECLLFKENFHRCELKYPISLSAYRDLLQDLQPYTCTDSFGDGNGSYTVSSIYFDTPRNQFYYETLNKQSFRQKVRLRAYNQCTKDSTVFFEIKMKYEGMVRKRRTSMPYLEAIRFLEIYPTVEEKNISQFSASNPQILKEVLFLFRFYALEPRAVVSYERLALTAREDPDTRITFDTQIRSRDYDLQLSAGSGGSLVANGAAVIMEVKANKNLPTWLADILSKYGCKDHSFSKYCSHYLKEEESYNHGIIERNILEARCY